jgi:hypothetical protein
MKSFLYVPIYVSSDALTMFRERTESQSELGISRPTDEPSAAPVHRKPNNTPHISPNPLPDCEFSSLAPHKSWPVPHKPAVEPPTMGSGEDTGSGGVGGVVRGAVLKALVVVGGVFLFRRLRRSTTRWDHARIVADALSGEKVSKLDPSRIMHFPGYSDSDAPALRISLKTLSFLFYEKEDSPIMNAAK